MFGPERTQRYIEDRVIEIAPLAFMRGRTLDKAFIILDEGQNATYAQLKMFLTRIGVSSRCIITGDLSQIDLPRKHQSGLNKCIHFLKQVEGVETVNLNNSDVIRHPLVARIINAFDEYEDKEEKQ
jgi:phosphate starvation-inducible PhoH-like protein